MKMVIILVVLFFSTNSYAQNKGFSNNLDSLKRQKPNLRICGYQHTVSYIDGVKVQGIVDGISFQKRINNSLPAQFQNKNHQEFMEFPFHFHPLGKH